MRTYSLAKLTASGDIDRTVPNRRVTQATEPKRKGWLVVDSWPANDQPPANAMSADALEEYQAWQRRNGYAG